MIKIGIFSGEITDTGPINLVQQFTEFKITGIARATTKQDLAAQQYSIEDLLSNSDAAYIDIGKPPFGLIEMAIKNSNHLFLKQAPSLLLSEIKQLSNLQHEAGTVIQFFNPHVFLTENLKITGQLKKTKLINIRMPLAVDELETQLVELLLFLMVAEKSELKKIDVFAFEGNNKSSMTNIRIVFSSGTSVQIQLAEVFKPAQSLIEIFQKDEKYVSLQAHQPSTGMKKTEQNALFNFIRVIQQKSAISISLNELEKTLFILSEIREKLKYSGCTFLS